MWEKICGIVQSVETGMSWQVPKEHSTCARFQKGHKVPISSHDAALVFLKSGQMGMDIIHPPVIRIQKILGI